MKLLTGMINFSKHRIHQLILVIQICTALPAQAQHFHFKENREKDAHFVFTR